MIETGIILLIKQTYFLWKNKQRSRILTYLKDFYQLTGPFHEFALQLKGQLTSKELLGSLNLPKKQRFFKNICPSLKRGQIQKAVIKCLFYLTSF